MLRYIGKRLGNMMITLFLISIVSFIIIQLPPGDYLTSYITQLKQRGVSVDNAVITGLTKQYGLDQPVHIQYFKWIWGVLQGNFGYSFEWGRPVKLIIWERLGMTLTVAIFTLLLTWAVSFPIGIYSATHQYSAGDYVFTFIGFIGLSAPPFLIALVLLWIAFVYFGQNLGGLFSSRFVQAPWSFARVADLLKHLWVPAVVLGLSGTAGLIRVIRANLLDEIGKPYVDTARAKGVSEGRLLFKYPVRIAIIPYISVIGWTLPWLFSGETITAVVLNLPTSGPILLEALKSQDMYLAGGFIMMLSVLTVIGTLVSDLVLAWVDPRIRLE